jgi:hypothetical protein
MCPLPLVSSCVAVCATGARPQRARGPPTSPAGLPSGLDTGEGFERYLCRVLSDPDRPLEGGLRFRSRAQASAFGAHPETTPTDE